MSSIPLEYEPSKAQKYIWGDFINEALGVDLAGWWMGWCPFHDTARLPESSTAQFHFSKGVMKCESEPSCLHPKRSMSLTNVLYKLVCNGQTHG